jgi:hypothetical protein
MNNMDYETNENQIVEYIRGNFNNFTDNSVSHFINEFLDFDMYTFDKSMFFQFDGYEYDRLTNESKLETLGMSVFIVVRNDTEKNLHKLSREYASAFYNMFEASGYNFYGLVDSGVISEIKFYDAVEGNKGIKLVKIDITTFRETI